MIQEEKIPAFSDGNAFVDHDPANNRLLVGNSNGIIRVFDLNDTTAEPSSVDIVENLTSMVTFNNHSLITSTSGELEMVELSQGVNSNVLTRSSLPLRDCCFINEGNRAIAGGDDSNLIIVDLKNNNKETKFSINEQLINMSYNSIGMQVSISLSNGDLQIYSVASEEPILNETIKGVLPKKVNTTIGQLIYSEENKEDLTTCKTCWAANGEFLAVPTFLSTIKLFNRSNFGKEEYELRQKTTTPIIDMQFSPNDKYLAMINTDHKLIIYLLRDKQIVKEFELSSLPLTLSWIKKKSSTQYGITIGTVEGEVIILDEIVSKYPFATSTDALTADMADESFGEESGDDSENEADNFMKDTPLTPPSQEKRSRVEEDDFVIDDDGNGYTTPSAHDVNGIDEQDHYNRGKRTKRHQLNGVAQIEAQSYKLKPFSAGGTPWIGDLGDRRYLSMNSIGYAWAVKTSNNDQQSITVSFFDRSINKEYHFSDLYNYDLCSMTENGILFGCSGLNNNKAKLYYRSHNNLQDSWERDIPIIENPKEFLTSIALSDNKVIVGSSLGYLRVFNIFGVCLSLEKTTPIVALIASNNLLFSVTFSRGLFNYSMINLDDSNIFYQRNTSLPLEYFADHEVLIKGIFFNEYNDPCIVGSDDTLLVLSNWRTPLQSRWIPILNIHEEANSKNKNKDLKCWPLGLYSDKFNCVIVKGKNYYPTFPLPIPIELDIKIPISVKNSTNANEDENDPEELFLRSMTMGNLVGATLNDDDIDNDDDIMDRLNQYSMNYDKSLLKLFADTCSDSKLAKAFSVVKLIKNDKALLAASKIAERMEFINLATRIGKLREARLEDED